MAPLDPFHLTPDVSLNRVRVVDLPGLYLDAGVRAKTGYELVSLETLARLIRQHAPRLAVDPAANDQALRAALEARLASPDPEQQREAERVARHLGRNLGYLLLALRRGDAANRLARPEWDDSYWQHWAGIEHVWLGGGLAEGALGERLPRYAQGVFEEAGLDNLRVEIAPLGAHLALVGAARRAPAEALSALVFDFGSSQIKRGLAHYDGPALVRLQRLPSLSTGWDAIVSTHEDARQQTEALFERIISAIVGSWEQAGAPKPAQLVASLSAYIAQGRLLPAQAGVYMQLLRLGEDIPALLAERLRAELNTPLSVTMLHDGTAAASVYAGAEHTAVLTIGTALGIGFPPPEEAVRPLSGAFEIVSAAIAR